MPSIEVVLGIKDFLLSGVREFHSDQGEKVRFLGEGLYLFSRLRGLEIFRKVFKGIYRVLFRVPIL